MAIFGCVWKFEEQRTNDRQTRAGELFDDRVKIRQQTVALLNVPAANVFLLGAMHPNFLVTRALLGVVAVNRLKRGELGPSREQFGSGRSDEAANIGAAETESAKPQIQEHRGSETKVIPGTGVVARPSHGVALATGVSGPSQDERPGVGVEFQQALIGGP